MSTVLALVLRENITLEAGKLADLLPYLAASIAAAALLHMALGIDRASWRYCALPDLLRVVGLVLLTTTSATLAMFVLNRMEGVSRSIPVLQALLCCALLIGARIAVRSWHQSHQRTKEASAAIESGSGKPANDAVLVVGVSTLASLYLRAADETAGSRTRVAAVVSQTPVHPGFKIRGRPVHGPNENVMEIVRDLGVHGVVVDRIVVAVEPDQLTAELSEQLLRLAREGMRIDTISGLLDLGGERKSEGASAAPAGAEGTDGAAAVMFDARHLAPGLSRGYFAVKRVLDVLASATLLVMLSPVILAVALAVRVSVGAPVLFWQQRPGLGGRPFNLYKFRTMAPSYDAAGRLLTEEQRVSVLGSFLRATRLDELPQLWNIFVGEMSFVGPRPLLLSDQVGGAMVRHLVRPGLTGWAQVMGGRAVSAEDKMALDVWYVQNASLLLVIKVAFHTIPMVLFGERVSREAIVRAWEDLRSSGVCRPPAQPLSHHH